MTIKLKPIEGRDGLWRFHGVEKGNGRIVFTSGESFANEDNAKRAMVNVRDDEIVIELDE